MRTLRTVSALLAVLAAAACHSPGPMGPDSADRSHPAYENGTAAPGTATPPDRPSHGGNYIGSGH